MNGLKGSERNMNETEKNKYWENKDLRISRMGALNNATLVVTTLVNNKIIKIKNENDMRDRIIQEQKNFLDSIYEGMETEIASPITPSTSKKSQPPSLASYFCDGCGQPITQGIKDFCEEHSDRFDGKIYCFDCQKKFPNKTSEE